MALFLAACGAEGELGGIDPGTVGAPAEIAAGYAEAIAENGPTILDLHEDIRKCRAATDMDEIEKMECMLAETNLSSAVSSLNSALSRIWYDLDDPDWAPDPSAPPPSDGLSGLALSFPSGPQVGRHPSIEEDGLVARTAVAVDDHSGGDISLEKLDRLVAVLEEWRGDPE